MAANCKARFTIGKSLVVEVEADTVTELMEKASFFGEVATKVEPGQPVQFFHRNRQNYNFYGLKDLVTGRELPFGQKKEGGFWPKDWEDPKYGQGQQEPQRDHGGAPDGCGEEPDPPRAALQHTPAPRVPPGGGVGAPPARPPTQQRKF